MFTFRLSFPSLRCLPSPHTLFLLHNYFRWFGCANFDFASLFVEQQKLENLKKGTDDCFKITQKQA